MSQSNVLSRVKGLLNAKKRRYQKLVAAGKPVTYKLPTGLTFELYPEGQIAELLYTMGFEFDLLSLVDVYLKKGMNVVDIGANSGLYSVIAGKKIGAKGAIWAFEPASDSMLRLKANMKVNKLTGFTAERAALSDKAGGFLNLVNEKGFGDGYRYLANGKGQEQEQFGEIEKVPVTTLDTYLKKAGSPRVDFLKVDVEGGEYGVLNGAKRTLTDNKDIVVLFESSPIGLERAGHSQPALHELMQSLGFDLYAWDDRRHTWSTDEQAICSIGNVWATRKQELLPNL